VKESNVQYKKFLGIENKSDHVRNSANAAKGLIALKYATNVDIDDKYMIHLKDGHSLIRAGRYRSGWTDGTNYYANKDGSLISINPLTYEETILMMGLGFTDITFVDTGKRILFGNKMFIGQIKDGVATVLGTPTVTFKQTMPASDQLAFYNARLYAAIFDTVIYSDAVATGRYDIRKPSLKFQGEVTLMAPVNGGVFFSDSAGTYFLEGSGPDKFIKKKIDTVCAKKGTVARVDNLTFGFKEYKNALMWTSTDGICIGGDGGMYENLTKDKYAMPAIFQGCAASIKKGELIQYITIGA